LRNAIESLKLTRGKLNFNRGALKTTLDSRRPQICPARRFPGLLLTVNAVRKKLYNSGF
jgi:hypothetical protein